MNDDIIHNPGSNSGIGFHLEHWVQTGYLASLLLGSPVPLKGNALIIALEFQARRKAQTDDLIIRYGDGHGSHFLQSKKGLEFNNNRVFNELINLTWKDYNNTELFDKEKDNFIFTTDQLSKTEINDTLVMLDWLRFSSDLEDFKGKIAYNKAKASRYNYFKDAVEKGTSEIPEEKDVYNFIKHIYVQNYDYLTSSSRDKEILVWSLQNFLNEGVTGSAAIGEMLNYVFDCNANAATVTVANVPDKIKNLFNLTTAASISGSLFGLLKKSSSSLEHTIFNEINGFHVERKALVDDLIELVEENQLVILEGEPGAGKSAIFKDLAGHLYTNLVGFIFLKADNLDRESLAETMSDLQVPLDFETMVSQWLLLPRLVIYIDSLEKLYESDKKGALLELVGIAAKHTRIKIISSCRTYALNDLMFKFRLDRLKNRQLSIPDFQESELSRVKQQFPGLAPLIDNPKLASIIKKPFYINMAVRMFAYATSGATLDLATFKKQLLEKGIQRKGDSAAGISAKRLTVFSQIVLDRAKAKMQFAEVRGEGKEEIVAGLLADNLLIESSLPGLYAPAHDVFEDIIVEHYFDEVYLTMGKDVVAFLKLSEPFPVLRRGIRWWAIQRFINYDKSLLTFIEEGLTSAEVKRYTKDELLIAILSTSNCVELLEEISTVLEQDSCAILKRLIILLHINFTIQGPPDDNNQTIKTNGPGWLAILTYIDRYNLYDELLLSLYRLVDKASLSYPPDSDLPQNAAIIAKVTLRHLADLRKETKNFSTLKPVYKILFRLTCLAKDEVEALINRVEKSVEERPDDDMAEYIVTQTTDCIQLYRFYPDKVISIFNSLWLNESEKVGHYGKRHDDIYVEWGLIDFRNTYSGPSAYRYPARYLLRFHPEKAIEFLVNFINRSIDCYAESAARKGRIGQLTFYLESGDKVTQMYNSDLWSLYRGLGNVPEVIQSFHMALEDFLLTTLEGGNSIKAYVDLLVKQSNSVSITAVICSVLIKYPFALGKEVLSFLRVKEFYELDFDRRTEDMLQAGLRVTPNNPYLANERANANALTFRQGTLEDLVLGLQVYGVTEVDGIIDDLKKMPSTNNTNWEFRFIRMDKREREIIETENALLLNPKPLPKKLQKIKEASQNDVNERLLSAAYIWATNQFKNDTPSDLAEWRLHYSSCLLKYSGVLKRIMQPQTMLAALGIRDHLAVLTEEEFNFAAAQMLKKLREICAGFRTEHFDALDFLERPVLQIIPELLGPSFERFELKVNIQNHLMELLLFLDANYIRDFIMGIRVTGWKLDPVFCAELSKVSINLYQKPGTHQLLSHLLRSEDSVTEDVFVSLVHRITDGDLLFAPENELESRGHYDRLRQGLIMIPFDNLTERHFDVIKKMYQHFIIVKRYGTTFTTEKENFSSYVGDVLSSESGFAKPMLEFVLENLPEDFDYGFRVINNMTLSGHDKKYPIWFWQRMITLVQFFITTNAYNGIAFSLFFGAMPDPIDIRYKLPEQDLVRNMYRSLITSGYFDETDIGPKMFRFLSGVGSIFQPGCLDWLLEGSGKFNNGMLYNSHEDLERFINQLYNEHLPFILARQPVKEYYLQLLEFLIDRESVLAFRIREEIF